MKNKKFTYFLGVVVAAIWGLIIYKVFKAISGDDTPVVFNEPVRPKGPLTDYAIPKDTTHLLLNYRDPFSAKKAEPVEIPASELIGKKPIKTVPQRPSVNWGTIKYSGFIHNPGSKKLIAILNVNGKEVMLSEGEAAEQVKLIRNMKDSVKVSYQGEIKFIVLSKSL